MSSKKFLYILIAVKAAVLVFSIGLVLYLIEM